MRKPQMTQIRKIFIYVDKKWCILEIDSYFSFR